MAETYKGMRKIQLLSSAVLLCLFTACSSVQLLTFEHLRPASVAFPEDIRNVAVVNNMPVEQTASIQYLRSVEKEYEGNGRIFTQELANAIAEGNYFEKVILCDTLLYAEEEDVAQKYHPLAPELVEDLCHDLGADVIISVDRLYIRTEDGYYFDDYYEYPIDAVNAKYASLLHLYVPGREKPFMTLAHQDTIPFELSLDLTNRMIADETSAYAARKEVNTLVPHWMEANRIYYDGGTTDFRDAGVALREHDWEEAYRLWSKEYERRKGKTQMRAAYNISLYYEMTDDIDQAIAWLDKAEALLKETDVSEKNTVTYYRAILMERKTELNKLNIQMKRFQSQSNISN